MHERSVNLEQLWLLLQVIAYIKGIGIFVFGQCMYLVWFDLCDLPSC